MLAVCLCLALFLALAACGKSAQEKWQEQYDLGMKYLLEENYEEAVVAFTAAIEIDEKKPEAYISLAEVYQAQEDWENALAALQQLRAELLETTEVKDREYTYGPEGGESVKERDGATTTERRDGFGNTVYHERVSAEEDGSSSSSIKEYEYGGDGRRERSTANSEDYYGGYRANGTHSHGSTTVIAYEYDSEGRLSGTTKERTYVEVTRTGTSTGTTIERSEYSYGDGVVTVNSHIENSYSSGSSDSWDNEETFEINAYGRKL